MTLAATLGKTVEWVMRNVSEAERLEWLRFYNVAPFGPRQEEVRAGVVGSIMANSFRGKGDDVVTPHMLFPSLTPPKAKGDGGRGFRAWTAAHNAAIAKAAFRPDRRGLKE